MARRIFLAALGMAALLTSASALAQDAGGTGGMTGAPAAGTASSAPAAPAIQLAPVQTPTITNSPVRMRRSAAAARSIPAAPRRASRHRRSTTPLDRNDFQEFIAQTIGQRLPLYGYNLFQRAPSTFAPVENIPVTPDYVVGPGDELLIRAWGQIDVDYRAVVDRNGMINIPRVGSIPVAGVRYQDLTDHVRTAVSRNFRNFELLVTMGQLRSVQIFVVGQARRPGAYTVSSLSTLVNAIFAAGGPSARGSMRAIQLKRGNQVVTEFDLYDLLLRGDKSKDAALLPGDVIYFPPVGPLAAISGSVKNPAIYELKGPTAVATLLDYAGGLTTTAQTRRATIERIDNRESRVVDQFALDMRRPRAHHQGRRPRLASSPSRRSSRTPSPCAATSPRRCAIPTSHGMRIRDLIPEKEALITPDYYRRKNLAVRVEAVAQGQLASSRRASSPTRSTGTTPSSSGRTQRTSPPRSSRSTSARSILENDPANNLPLQPGDIVTVFSKTDVGAPADRRPVVVRLEGEFNFAGVYQAQPGETLRQLVMRVGGVTPHAYVFGAEFNRESTRRNQEERLKQAVDQLEQDVQRAAFTRAQNVIAARGRCLAQTGGGSPARARFPPAQLKPTGRIVLEMPETANVADLPDIALEDGDRLSSRSSPPWSASSAPSSTNPLSFTGHRKTSPTTLPKPAGPARKPTRKAFTSSAPTAPSSASSRDFFGSLSGMAVMPGDTIVVPEDFQRTTWTKDLKDWTQIFYQFGLGAAALKVIRD